MGEMKSATFNDDLAPDAHTLDSMTEAYDRSLYINHLRGKFANGTKLSAKTLERTLRYLVSWCEVAYPDNFKWEPLDKAVIGGILTYNTRPVVFITDSMEMAKYVLPLPLPLLFFFHPLYHTHGVENNQTASGSVDLVSEISGTLDMLLDNHTRDVSKHEKDNHKLRKIIHAESEVGQGPHLHQAAG